MSFTVPATWAFFGSSNNGNTVQYTLPGHTAQSPRLAIFKRVPPVYANSKWSKPSYDVKVVYGVVDADGLPVSPYIQVGTDGIRFPMVGVNVATLLQEACGVFATLVSETDFAAAVYAQLFPIKASS